jgi:hypothetical protein
MTQEEKELLLKDLCGRLAYGVILFDNLYNRVLYGVDWFNPINGILTTGDKSTTIEEIKPYLRPMSSMTKEEAEDYNDLVNELSEYDCQPEHSASKLIDWLNTHHFDYHGLIEKGLAIEVTEENNPYGD